MAIPPNRVPRIKRTASPPAPEFWRLYNSPEDLGSNENFLPGPESECAQSTMTGKGLSMAIGMHLARRRAGAFDPPYERSRNDAVLGLDFLVDRDSCGGVRLYRDFFIGGGHSESTVLPLPDPVCRLADRARSQTNMNCDRRARRALVLVRL